ncbi:MAG: hypothetical protein ABIL40_08400 [candidate division WOR-3 bacterium]
MKSTGPVKNLAVVSIIKNMAERISRSCTRGGVFLLLPFVVYGAGTLSFNISATDNINMLSLKEPGIVFSLTPIYDFKDHLGFHYDGAFSLINLTPENLIIENYLRMEKTIDFEGIGNKNIIAGKIYSFFPVSFKIYQLFDFGLSDSLNYYIKDRYLFAPDIKFRYRYFLSDSIIDYTEVRLGTGIRFPLPYFFFTPYGAMGMRYINQNLLFLYSLVFDFSFPLTGDFSLSAYLKYDRTGEAEHLSPIALEYADDPFFEYENLHQTQEIQIAMHRLWADTRISGSFMLYKKDFFPAYDQTRADNGFVISINYTKIIERNIALSVGIESVNNYSSINDFDYTKNSGLLNIRLTF